MSAAEFREWLVYYLIEPFGEDRADLRMGIMACATLSPHVRKGVKLRPADFIPKFNRADPQSAEHITDSLRKLTAMRGGTINGSN